MGDYEAAYAQCVELKGNIEELRQIRELNQLERQTKKVGFYCFRRTMDAEQYYIDQINSLKA